MTQRVAVVTGGGRGIGRQIALALAADERTVATVAYFASEDAGFITGQTLSVSGGLTMA